jgi:argininosuccinate synthase
VSGTVRLRLHKGQAIVVGRKSDVALYQHALATYDVGDTFDHQAAKGFIDIYGLPVRTQARVQGKGLEK